ncbi:hypothetical protein MRX96_053931 [Rhipicephalus microplus]
MTLRSNMHPPLHTSVVGGAVPEAELAIDMRAWEGGHPVAHKSAQVAHQRRSEGVPKVQRSTPRIESPGA